MHINLVKRGDQRIHVDNRHARFDHLLDRCGQCVDAERLDGDEVPSIAARCLASESSPANQVTSTLKLLTALPEVPSCALDHRKALI
jgi:hypothetical protein